MRLWTYDRHVQKNPALLVHTQVSKSATSICKIWDLYWAKNQDKMSTLVAQSIPNFLLLEAASCSPYVLNRRKQSSSIVKPKDIIIKSHQQKIVS